MITCNKCAFRDNCDTRLILMAKGFKEDDAYCCAAKPIVNPEVKTYKKKFSETDCNGFGYYALIDGCKIQLGVNWPHEGGIYWEGDYDDFLTEAGNFKKECPYVYNQVVKHFIKR